MPELEDYENIGEAGINAHDGTRKFDGFDIAEVVKLLFSDYKEVVKRNEELEVEIYEMEKKAREIAGL